MITEWTKEAASAVAASLNLGEVFWSCLTEDKDPYVLVWDRASGTQMFARLNDFFVGPLDCYLAQLGDA